LKKAILACCQIIQLPLFVFMQKKLQGLPAILGFFIYSIVLTAQGDLPADYLSKEFHAGCSEALRQIMPGNSVFIVLAYPVRSFSNDVDYFFHQNPDMYYFSGNKEPHSLLLIFKDEQKAGDGSSYKEILFVQPCNAQAEQWTGRRL
jgi:Xaa-Pro aminopeptidase